MELAYLQYFMFLFRIGKEKWTYNLSMTLHKLRYSQVKELSRDSQIKIDIKRGSHLLTFVSTVNKRGKIIYDTNTQSFPMTLWYDLDSKQFNQKEMVIEGKILNELSQELVHLGEAELNIAEYAPVEGKQEFVLEIELEGGSQEQCRVKFDVAICRTAEGNELSTQVHKMQLNSQMDKHKARFTSPDLSSITKKDLRSERSIEENSIGNCFCLATNDSRMKKTEQPNRSYLNTIKQKSVNEAEQSFDTVILKKPNLKNLQSEEQSAVLKLYQTQKMLKIRQKQLSKVKKQLQDQKTINDVLMQQQKKQIRYNQSKHLAKQVQLLQTQLEVANMKIFHLESQNKSYLEQVQTAESDVEKLNNQVVTYRSSLQKQKMKIAQLIQRTFQSGNYHLLTFVQSLIEKQ